MGEGNTLSQEPDTGCRMVMDAASRAMAFIADDTVICQVNSEFERLTGYAREELEGRKSWTELVDEEDVERLKRYHELRRIDPQAAPAAYEFNLRDRAGRLKNAFAAVSMVPATGISIASIRQTQEFKPADGRENAVPQSRFKMVLTNARLARLVEDRWDDLGDRPVISLFPQSFSESVLGSVAQVYRKRQPVKFESTVYLGGRNLDVMVVAVPLYGREEDVTSALVTVTDVTDLKRAERLLLDRLTTKDLTLMRSEFVSTMSHELRTPLNNIIGYTELLMDQFYGKVNEKQLRQLENIHTSGIELMELINDVLDFSLLEMGELEQVVESFRLDDVIDDVYSICEPMASGMRQSIELDVKPGLVAWADPLLVKQCLYNLLSNAIRRTPRGGIIRLSARNAREMVAVSVKDAGRGIPKDQLDAMFQPFYRADASSNGVTGSTGLRLTITRRLVEMMGGKVWAESEEGKGSEFHFTLPIKPPTHGTV